jgi:hypothetical protein
MLARWRRVGLGRFGVLLLSAAAIAGGRAPAAEARMVAPIRLRMDGYVGAPPGGRREMEDLTLRCATADVRFQVTDAVLLSGGGLASRVFDRVRPYEPNFFLRGSEALVKRVCGAEAGSTWRLVGMWRPGSRDLLLASVEHRE